MKNKKNGIIISQKGFFTKEGVPIFPSEKAIRRDSKKKNEI
jgi:hypothetical protein